VDEVELFEEAIKYYANILTPYSEQVGKKIAELLAMNVPVNMILPSHGVLWRRDPLQIVRKYQQWAAQTPEKSAVVVFDTMWDATRRMAEAIGDGLGAEGVPHKLFHMSVNDRNDVLTEVFKSRAVILGSPSMNRGILPSMAPIVEDLKGLRFKNKIGAAFGSYGWSGECVKVLEEHLAAAKIPVVAKGVAAKWQPTSADLENCRKLGREVAAAVKE
jgi:flavorubredoxin